VCPGQLPVEHFGGEAAVVQLQIVGFVPVPNPWPQEHNVTDPELLVARQREVGALSGGDDRKLDEAVGMDLDWRCLDVAAGGGKHPFGEVGVSLCNGYRQFRHASGYRPEPDDFVLMADDCGLSLDASRPEHGVQQPSTKNRRARQLTRYKPDGE
jgi:hypothetical protein